jgi:hypothetical protein
VIDLEKFNNSQLPDIGNNTKEVATGFFNAMIDEPCMMTIVVILIISLLIIRSNNKHQEKMEEIRMKQFKQIKGGNGDN